MPRIVGYTFEADAHCVSCTQGRFALNGDGVRRSVDEPLVDEHGIPHNAYDREGNRVHPVFATDEGPDDMYCGDCYVLVSEGTRADCAECGSRNHDAANCPVGDPDDYDDEPYYDEPFTPESNECASCTCEDCLAADAYGKADAEPSSAVTPVCTLPADAPAQGTPAYVDVSTLPASIREVEADRELRHGTGILRVIDPSPGVFGGEPRPGLITLVYECDCDWGTPGRPGSGDEPVVPGRHAHRALYGPADERDQPADYDRSATVFTLYAD